MIYPRSDSLSLKLSPFLLSLSKGEGREEGAEGKDACDCGGVLLFPHYCLVNELDPELK